MAVHTPTLAPSPAVRARVTAPRVRWWVPRSWTASDRRWVALLAGIPVVVFVTLAVTGHPVIVADNLLQNYPLRILTARQIDAGHWPVWNPYSYSGTPLLAGMNAGSFYPGTMLFVFLPGIVAWIANLIVVYWCAAIGLYVLARWLGTGPLAAGLAALTYAFGGVMVGQLVHVAVVQGQALLPLLVLAQLVLSRRLLGLERGASLADVGRRALGPSIALTCLVGLVCLTGEPRSIADAEIVLLVVCACELLAHGSSPLATVRGRVAYLVATVASTAVGIAIAAAQLLPGWNYITMSERSNISYYFFGTGSMPWRWLSLFLVPGALGDNGVARTSRFFANYNLPEVTVYVGLLAAAAAFAFGAQLFGRSTAPRRRYLPFFVLVVAGLLLTMGATTPFGVLFHEIPLFGKTRLQNRNAVFFDFGATVLLAWWLDAVFAGRLREASLAGARRFATFVPITIALGLALWGVIAPASLAVRIATDDTPTATAGGARASLALSLLVAVGIVVVLLARVGVRRRARLLVVLAVVDLLAFNLFFQSGLISGLPSPFPDTPRAHALLGTYGRIAVVDPLVLSYHVNAQLGFGNLDIFTQLQSVQGYGSLVAARYNDATGARLLGTIGGCQLARGNFVPLRLSAMAISRSALIGTPPHLTACEGHRSSDVRRYFGLVLRVERVRFAGPGVATTRPRAHVVLVTSTGRLEPVRPTITTAGSAVLTASFPTAPKAAGVELLVRGGATVDSSIVYAKGAATEPLNVSLQVGLSQRSWHLVAVIGHTSYFKANVGPPVWLAQPASGSSARVVSSDDAGDLTVAVTAPRATTLVRSVAWFPGWTATVTPSGGTARTESVTRDGLIQAVAIPAGRETVRFYYDAPYLDEGLVLSSIGLAVVLVAAVALLALRRRGGRRRGRHAAVAM